ncbi:MAG TPA: DUF1353 domain-containing protein [Cyclobacteriaceae bacterium]
MTTFGTFSGNPKTEWLTDDRDDDRNMKLLEDFTFSDTKGKVWLAPKNSIINGASIPRPLWSSVGSPYTDDYRRASIVHDVACDDKNVPRKDADVMFYYACLAGGCSKAKANILYAGVRIGAWSSRFVASEALKKNNLLFRIPTKTNSDVQFLKSKFEEIALELQVFDDNSTIEELDKVIEKHIKF